MSTTSYIFVYYSFEGPEHEYGFEDSESGSDAGDECRGGGDVEGLVTGRSPSPLPSPPSPALSSVSSVDSLSSYETCSDFEAGPPSDPDSTPWYLRPTPSPVFPASPSFEWELSFHTAVGGNDSLFDDKSRYDLFPSSTPSSLSTPPLSDSEATTPRCADFNHGNLKTEQVSPILLWDDFKFNAMERTSTGDSGTLVNTSGSATGSREGSATGWAPGKSPSATPELCGWSSDEGYEADSESRLASAALGRRATSSRKRANLKRKRGADSDERAGPGDAGGPRVFGPGGHFDQDYDGDDEGPAQKKRKAGPHFHSSVELCAWQEQMMKMKADGTFGAVMPGGTFLQLVLDTLNGR
ncbi:hypothetical protein GSI_02988 [Ganoderma sinense ZZ0214-1]|uniref:Uncharacterized protein n=1 Tax=Ganoderma sinense ZZ0214-1 TaxID=1077348 RepID=A0A2G8SNP9_9APHY|nr:hypothetical protein GSI_02988 [Ganoderma sinense ZZ0214-1]